MEAELIKVAVLGIVTAVFVMIVSEKQPEIGLVIALAFGVMALVIAFGKAGAVIGAIEDAIDKAGIDARLLVPVLKVTGMAYITQFSADICKDAGQNSIAGKVETVVKIMMLVVAVPIATSLIQIISTIL